MGYAPNVAVGAWSGNNNNTKIADGVLSGLITAPMWREFMDVALAELPKENFSAAVAPDPSIKPILRGEILDIESLLHDGYFENTSASSSVPILYNSIHSILHFVELQDPNGPYPTYPESDSQYANWEYGVEQWKKRAFGNLFKINPATTSVPVVN